MDLAADQGLVIKTTGSWYDILKSDMEIVRARIVGKLRLVDKKLTNPVAVGDHVTISEDNETGDTLITGVLPRTNYVVRQSPRKKHDLHMIASNVDQAIVVVTIRNPNLKQGFIDRFLLMTEPHDIPAIVVFNKADLYDEEDLALFYGLKEIYDSIGYTTLLVSAATGDGVEPLAELLQDKVTLMGGQSGVGKSTLINALQPSLDLRTSELSDYTGKGQHTTTFAEMFPLEFGGFIIDIPGIKTLSFNNLEVMDVAHNFRELFAVSGDCKFPDCTHRSEPKCAVVEAVENGDIFELRYMNYLKIIDEIEQQNYWERHGEL